MKQSIFGLVILSLFLTACKETESNNPAPGGNGQQTHGTRDPVTEWQTSFLGQEGHGGDAVVCFTIPVDQALYQEKLGPEKDCPTGSPCPGGGTSTDSSGKTGRGSGTVWRMTEAGRKSIRMAQPLEQYLGARIESKKRVLDQLNQLSPEEGYRKILQPFTRLPAAFNRISEIHQKLGWLHEDGIASEYGLLDINDSGFVNENEIDKIHCKELQAVVRRDSQLWYDAGIVSHFDNAGKILIQLHEEIYAWGKAQDQINAEIPGPAAHQTSTKTRRLILKLLDESIDQALVNENLKALGFSTMYWENMFKVPTSVGYFMDTDACVNEQKVLQEFFSKDPRGHDYVLDVARLLFNRYIIHRAGSEFTIQLKNNFPDALSNMISLTLLGQSSPTFTADIQQLQSVFERPESCEARFD